MATTVPIEIFMIARTTALRGEMQKWLEFKGVKNYELPPEPVTDDDGEHVINADEGPVTDAATVIGVAAKRCFDDKTEILTDSGWKKFDTLDRSEQVLTFNTITGMQEWEQPHGYYAGEHAGQMVEVVGRDISMAVTLDHRVYGRGLRQAGTRNGFITGKDLLTCGQFCVPLSLGTWKGEVPEEIRLPDYTYQQEMSNHSLRQYGTATRTLTRTITGQRVIAFAKLLTYYVTEGTADHSGDDFRYIAIYGDHFAEVAALCTELGLKCSQVTDKRNGCPKIRIGGGRQMAAYVVAQCGHGSAHKRLPRWVLDLPRATLEQIWDILVVTDGCIRPRGQESYQSVSPTLIGQAQEILVKIGAGTTISTTQPKHRPGAEIQSRLLSYETRRKAGRFAVVNNAKSKAKAKLVDYSGHVYCVSTRNGIVCVRREGKVFWSGNCYMSFDTSQNPNLTRVRSDWTEYLDNVMKVGHGSVLEHSTFTFAIENVSRVFTGEMNRHRAGWAISEGSMRFIRFSEAVPYWEPESIKGPDVFADNKAERALDWLRKDGPNPSNVDAAYTIEHKKHLTRIIFANAFDKQREDYALLERIWATELAPTSTFKQKKELTSLFRRIVGMGCATGGVWTGNVRALRHVLTMRCEPAAEEEILHVFSRIAKMMVECEPMLFGDFHLTDTNHWVPRYKKV